jgi:hypothetical protein
MSKDAFPKAEYRQTRFQFVHKATLLILGASFTIYFVRVSYTIEIWRRNAIGRSVLERIRISPGLISLVWALQGHDRWPPYYQRYANDKGLTSGTVSVGFLRVFGREPNFPRGSQTTNLGIRARDAPENVEKATY